MARETARVEFNTSVSNLSRNIEARNIISISLDFINEGGTVPPSGYSQILLKPRDLTRMHITQLLLDQQVPESRNLGRIIARDINHKLANDNSLRQPVFAYVDVTFIRSPYVPTPSRRSASMEILQRLAEEQRVESMDFEEGNETQCSICIEDLSKIHQTIIQMPKCLHMFHQNCLFEWLVRQNSCPLCRTVPYEDDQQTKTQRLA